MKRFVLVTALALVPFLAPSPAQADNPVILTCTEIPAPTFALVATSTDPLYRPASVRNSTSLVTTKAHPMRKDVFYVQCNGENLIKGSTRWMTACKIIADSFGQWIENGTGRGGQRLVWQTWNCADVLNRF